MFYKANFTTSLNTSGAGSYVYDYKGGKPFFNLIQIKPGIFMTIVKQSENDPQDIEYEINNAPVTFSYVISGSSTHRLQEIGESKTAELKLRPLTSNIDYLPNVSGHLMRDRDDSMLYVDLKVDRLLLRTFLENQMDRVPKKFHTLVTSDSRYYISTPLERDVMNIAMEVVNPPALTGVALTLFYESRALDLLSRQLDILTHETSFPCQGIDRGDLERIHHARKLLVKDLENPPTIVSLARMCGINEFKLKKGFKQVFKTTIFSYRQKKRMDRGWHLLQQGNHSVTEVAFMVGYSNISHFAVAFRKQFGVNPGVLKKGCSIVPPNPDTH